MYKAQYIYVQLTGVGLTPIILQSCEKKNQTWIWLQYMSCGLQITYLPFCGYHD